MAGDRPKPLLRFADRSILAHTLSWLAAAGIREVWINLHFGADMIRDEIGDGAAFGLSVTYVYEPQLLGTAGALANIAPVFEDRMLVVYGDSVVRLDLAALLERHARSGVEATLAVFDQGRHHNTGIAGGRVRVDASGSVVAFVEGPGAGDLSPLVNAGVYALEPTVLDLIPTGCAVDFGREVFPAMLCAGRPVDAYVIDDGGFCLGLDTPESYRVGQGLLASGALSLS